MKKKLSVLAVMAGFVLVIIYLLHSNNDLQEQLKQKLEEETVLPDQQLEERLDALYEEKQEEITATAKLKELGEEFLTIMYQAPSGEYGQVPYVQELLSDQGIRNLLKRMNPERYEGVPNELIENIRTAIADKNSMDATPFQIIAKDSYVRLSEDKTTGEILIFADVSFSDDSNFATISVLLCAACVREDENWKIDAIKDFRQL